MVPGMNKMVQHDGKDYLIQCEDLGVDHGYIEIRVVEGGSMVWRKQVAYGDVLNEDLAAPQRDQAIRSRMQKTFATVEAAIARGRLLTPG